MSRLIASDGNSPAPDEIYAARTAAGLDKYSAALLIYRTVKDWKAWESGIKKMDPAYWELRQIKVARWSSTYGRARLAGRVRDRLRSFFLNRRNLDVRKERRQVD